MLLMSFSGSLFTMKKMDSMENTEESQNNKCSICLEGININRNGYIRFKCNHEYHCSCIKRWFREGKSNCPNCRTTLIEETSTKKIRDLEISNERGEDIGFLFDDNLIFIPGNAKNDEIQANPCKTVTKVKKIDDYYYIQYSDNQIELYGLYATTKSYDSDNTIRGQANKDKTIEKEQLVGYKTLCINHSDGTIELFGIYCGELKPKAVIQPKANKIVKSMELLCKGILKIEYTDGETTLFCTTENQSEIKTREPIRYTTINKHANISPSTIALIYSDSKADLVNAFTGRKINKDIIQANPKKKIRHVEMIGESIVRIRYNDKERDYFNTNNSKKINKDKKMQSWKTMRRYNTLFIVYEDNEIELFDVNSGQRIITMQANREKDIRSTVLVQDGKRLYVKYENQDVDLFEIDTCEKVNKKTIKLREELDTLSILKKKLIAVYSSRNGGKLDVFNAKSGEKINTKIIEANRCIRNAQIDFADNILGIKYPDKKSEIFNMKSGEKINLFDGK